MGCFAAALRDRVLVFVYRLFCMRVTCMRTQPRRHENTACIARPFVAGRGAFVRTSVITTSSMAPLSPACSSLGATVEHNPRQPFCRSTPKFSDMFCGHTFMPSEVPLCLDSHSTREEWRRMRERLSV